MLTGMQTPILIVDDYLAMLRLLRRVLQVIGFTQIDQANSGSSALQKLRKNAYGLIISDFNMEPMSGLELIKETRADHRLQCLPFIMLTASTERDKVLAAKENGVTGYIIKPFTTETVQRKLASILGPLCRESTPRMAIYLRGP